MINSSLARLPRIIYRFLRMLSLTKPDVVLTHESDLDGLVAGLLLQRLSEKVFNHSPRLESYPYDIWKQRNMKEACAWVSDFALEPRLDKPNWLIVDHHPHSVAIKNAQVLHDPSKSASLLCYDLCQQYGIESELLTRLVRYSNIADLFLEDDPDFGVAMDYANLVKSYQFWNLHALIEGSLEKLIDHPLLEVMATKRRVEDPIGFNWSENNIVDLAPQVGYVDTVVGNVNLIVHQLLKRHSNQYDVLITLFRKGNGLVIVSLRSRNGQALTLATKLHGGGHPNAAGATLPRSINRIPDAVEYLRKVLNPTVASQPALNSLENLFDAVKP